MLSTGSAIGIGISPIFIGGELGGGGGPSPTDNYIQQDNSNFVQQDSVSVFLINQ